MITISSFPAARPSAIAAQRHMRDTSAPAEKHAPRATLGMDLLAGLPAELQHEARELVRDVADAAHELRAARRRALSLAPRIAAFKERLCKWGGDRKSAAIKSERSDLIPTWAEFVGTCFGVCEDTIDNWLKEHEARGRFVQLLDGQPVTFKTTHGFTKEKKTVVVPPDKFPREVLEAELDEIDLGNKPATRAWAGLQTGQRAGSKRAPIDHLLVWEKACTALRPANYRALIGAQKTTAIRQLVEALLQLPQGFRADLIDELQRSIKEDSR